MKKILTKQTILRFFFFLCLTAAAVFVVLGNMKVQASQINYDGAHLTWNRVPFAGSYELVFNGGQPATTEEATFHYPDGGDFDLTLTVHKTLFGDQTVEKKFRHLKAVTGLYYADGALHWDSVANAVAYAVEVNGKVYATVTEPYFAYADEGGDTVFRVKALGPTEDYYSFFSEAYAVRILDTVKNVAYDCNENKITWDPVSDPDVAGYTVRINGVDHKTTQPFFAYDAKEQDFTLSIRVDSVLSDRVFDSKFTPTRYFTYLPTVTDLELKDGVLVWSPSAGADSYTVHLNGTDHTVTEPIFTQFLPNTDYQVSVQPCSTKQDTYSYRSEVLSFRVLQVPTVTVKENADPLATSVTFTWTVPEKVVGRLYLNGALLQDNISLDQTTKEYTYAFADSGVYTFQIQAAQTATSFASAWSEPITVTRLAPVASHTLSEITADPGSKAGIRFASVEGASSYRVVVNGNIIHAALKETFFDLTDMQGAGGITFNGTDLNISILPNGNKTDPKALILSPLQSYTFTVTRLARPAYLTLTDERATWIAVPGAAKYLLVVNYNGTEEKRFMVNELSYPLKDLISRAGDYTFYVMAVGDGTEGAVSSDHSIVKKAYRLEVPQNLRIENSNHKKLLRWDAVKHAVNYEIRIGTVVKYTTATAFDITDFAKETMQEITVRAIGDPKEAEVVLNSATTEPLQFCQLAAPTNVKVNNDQIAWDAVENATGYRIYINDEYETEVIGQTTFDHNGWGPLAQAGEYKVTIQAYGKDDASFDSGESAPVTVVRLARPTLNMLSVGTQSISWNLPTGVKSVELLMDHAPVSLPANATKYTPDFSQAGSYTMELRFIGNGEATQTKKGTISSEALERTFTVVKLGTPKLELSGTQLRVLSDSLPESALRDYFSLVLYKNGVKVTEQRVTNSTFATKGSGIYTVEVKANYFAPNADKNEVYYYLTSDRSNSVYVP